MLKSCSVPVVVFLTSAAWAPPAHPATITDIGPVISRGPTTGIQLLPLPFGLNNSGQVLGSRQLGTDPTNNPIQAFLYSGGATTYLGTLGGIYSAASSINDAGKIVGTSWISDRDEHAFSYSGGVMTDLGTLGGSDSDASAINNSGQIVGSSLLPGDNQLHAFLYSNGAMTDLGNLPGHDLSQATAINDAGQIAGFSDVTYLGSGHAFLYSAGVMSDLGTLGGLYSDAFGINNKGEVVGDAYTQHGEEHAFLYSAGGMTDLGTLGSTFSQALDINDAGQVVGVSVSAGGRTLLAFLYANGAMIDLNSLLPPGSPWLLEEAIAINNSGQIVGFGTINGQQDEFLLDTGTVPEPASWALCITGAVLLALLGLRPATTQP